MKPARILLCGIISGYLWSWAQASAESLNVYVTPDNSVIALPIIHGQLEALLNNNRSILQLRIFDLKAGDYRLCKMQSSQCEVVSDFSYEESDRFHTETIEAGVDYRALSNTLFVLQKAHTEEEVASFIYTRDAINNNLSKLLTRIIDDSFQANTFGARVALPDHDMVFIAEPGSGGAGSLPTEPKGSLYLFNLVTQQTERLQVGEANDDELGKDYLSASHDGNTVLISSKEGPVLLSNTSDKWQASRFPLPVNTSGNDIEFTEITLSPSGRTAFGIIRNSGQVNIFEIDDQNIISSAQLEGLGALRSARGTDDTMIVFNTTDSSPGVTVWQKVATGQWTKTQTITDIIVFKSSSKAALSGNGRLFFVSSGDKSLATCNTPAVAIYEKTDIPGMLYFNSENILIDSDAGQGSGILLASCLGDTFYVNTGQNKKRALFNRLVDDNELKYFQKSAIGLEGSAGLDTKVGLASLHPNNGMIVFSADYSGNKRGGGEG